MAGDPTSDEAYADYIASYGPYENIEAQPYPPLTSKPSPPEILKYPGRPPTTQKVLLFKRTLLVL